MAALKHLSILGLALVLLVFPVHAQSPLDYVGQWHTKLAIKNSTCKRSRVSNRIKDIYALLDTGSGLSATHVVDGIDTRYDYRLISGGIEFSMRWPAGQCTYNYNTTFRRITGRKAKKVVYVFKQRCLKPWAPAMENCQARWQGTAARS
jgi:hypothetical protein